MDEQNRDHFYEGPPLEEQERWHDGAVAGERANREVRASEPLADVELPETGAYPLPETTERPHATRSGLEPAALTRDPSMSRAVDRAAEGLDPEAAGYDRAAEGPSPGPLEPTADEAPADSGDDPSGGWGSSG